MNNNTKTMDFTNLFGGSAGEGFNEFINTIRLSSPVEQINFNSEDRDHITGMTLLTSNDEEIKEYKTKLEKRDLNDNTLLYFPPNVIKQSLGIIHGALLLLKNRDIINNDPDKYIDDIIYNYLYNYIRYKKFKSIYAELDFVDIKLKDLLEDRIKFIIEDVWFLPYNILDSITDKSINNFKESKEKNE